MAACTRAAEEERLRKVRRSGWTNRTGISWPVLAESVLEDEGAAFRMVSVVAQKDPLEGAPEEGRVAEVRGEVVGVVGRPAGELEGSVAQPAGEEMLPALAAPAVSALGAGGEDTGPEGERLAVVGGGALARVRGVRFDPEVADTPWTRPPGDRKVRLVGLAGCGQAEEGPLAVALGAGEAVERDGTGAEIGVDLGLEAAALKRCQEGVEKLCGGGVDEDGLGDVRGPHGTLDVQETLLGAGG